MFIHKTSLLTDMIQRCFSVVCLFLAHLLLWKPLFFLENLDKTDKKTMSTHTVIHCIGRMMCSYTVSICLHVNIATLTDISSLYLCLCPCFTFQSEVTDKLRFTTFYFYFSLVVCELILCCFNEKPPLFSNVVTDPVSHTSGCSFHSESIISVCPPVSYSIIVNFCILCIFRNLCVCAQAGHTLIHTHR